MNIILCSVGGKMGQAIVEVAKKTDFCKIVAGVDKTLFQSKSDFDIFECPNCVNTENADVVIDFSHPDNLSQLLSLTQRLDIPIVIGTTGYSEKDFEQLRRVSKKIPVFYSRNMSFGINLMIELCKTAAKVFGTDFDIEIVEKHHRHKIDAPSGTALMLAESISSCRKGTQYVFDRSQKNAPRTREEIGIHSIRGGTDAGFHDVIFSGSYETLSISHSAQSREIFARGALKAADFLIGKPAGMYSMENLILEC